MQTLPHSNMTNTTFTTDDGKIITISNTTSISMLLEDMLFTLSFVLASNIPDDLRPRFVTFNKFLEDLKHDCDSGSNS